MKKVQRGSFKLYPIAASLVLAIAAQLAAIEAYANAGYGTNTDLTGKTIAVPTYYANSPQGVQPALDPTTHLPCTIISAATNLPIANPAANATTCLTAGTVDTGVAMRKFVDPLAGVDATATIAAGTVATAGTVGIPLAIPEKWKNPLTLVQTADDYYEIAIVEYRQNMHSDLVDYTASGVPATAHGTLLRGYVQIETPAIAAGLADAAGVKSQHVQLFYPDGITPIKDALGNLVYGVHAPHYLGPIIIASRGTAVRMKYTNYMPYNDTSAAGGGKAVGYVNGGEMPIPVDEYTAGGGPAIDKTGKPVKFTQNRADIHWHGGDSPWISDGTPHQWVAPAGEALAYSVGIGKGASAQNVPDMPDPGPGAGTLYFPNNLSARLMFYHDHTSGLTKLNVYDGVAAGYVVTDPVEQGLVKNGVIPNTLLGVGIPLVIQDKTFVPKNIGPAGSVVGGVTVTQSQDAKWDLAHWGQPGDLWFPHVYETNQDPNSIDGTNPVGRWDWGPWFWPIFPSQYSLPSGAYGDVTATPEAFMDTPIVNGQAYPTLTVDPTAYRFRILSVPNDRSISLNLYEAVDASGKVCDSNPTSLTYLATPAVAPLATGQTGALATCTEVKMVPAAPTAGFPTWWPTDGRAGGVPDPTTAGPDIIQIGNEAGLLPAPAIWPAQPIYYEQNVRRMTLLNVLKHGLLLGSAERADVIIDFSKYAGKTLILYNDAPAPMPGFDPRIDYFTGEGDQTVGGGAYNTMPGYGPNTRTIMQFKVNATNTPVLGVVPAITPFDTAKLAAALPAAYAASQPKPNIPESAYNTAFGTNDTNHYAQIYAGASTLPNFEWTLNGAQSLGAIDPLTGLVIAGSGVTVVDGGIGFTSAPTVKFSGGGATTQATATATIDPVLQTVKSITVTNPGAGYTSAPTVTLVGGGGYAATLTVQTTATKSIPVINKAIQELFDPVYGRMNATLAVELHLTNSVNATTVPLAYIDAPVDAIDAIKDGETQIWKITHNGVDSHPVHFHLVNVQVLNRVDWAGVVKPPEANELGWKETLRMNPLEDVFVAVKAVHPVVPFGLPQSTRRLDPTQVLGSQLGFTQIDPWTGLAPLTPFSNVVSSFDNEYVWHCHILGHEENDFMRPFVFHPNVVVPDAPSNMALTGSTLTWTDPTPFGGVDYAGVPTAGLAAGATVPTSNPKNEIGFKIQRALNGGPFTTVASVPANVTTWTDPALPTGYTSLAYHVVAFNVVGDSLPATLIPPAHSLTATTSFITPAAVPGTLADTSVALSWAAFAATNIGYNVHRNGVLLNTTAPLTTPAYTDTPVNEGATYHYQVFAVNTVAGTKRELLPAATLSVTTPSSSPLAPTGLAVVVGATTAPTPPSATLSWVDNAFNETGYVVQRQPASAAGITCPDATGLWTTLITTPANATSFVDNAAVNGAFYCYRVAATNAIVNTTGTITWLMTPTAVSMPSATIVAAIPAAITGLSQTSTTVGAVTTVTLSWNPVAGAASYNVTVGGVTTSTTATSYSFATGLSNANVTVSAVSASGAVSAVSSLFNGIAYSPVNFTAASGASAGSITLTWANNPLNVNIVSGLTLLWQPFGTATPATWTSKTFAPTTTGATIINLTSGTTYNFQIQAVSSIGNSVLVPATPLTATAK